MPQSKSEKRQGALNRWKQILSNIENPTTSNNYSSEYKSFVTSQINTLEARLRGEKKKRVVRITNESDESSESNTWAIDIYKVNYGYVKNSQRRKNKGNSNKNLKLSRPKTTTFVKTVVSRPGLMERYRAGLEGLSPKQYAFKMRNTAMCSSPA